jgi:2-oxoglutarate dehydrogenase complex dehydrogenase (E1) component-like enzyme
MKTLIASLLLGLTIATASATDTGSMQDIRIILTTNKGPIEATLLASKAPVTVANYLNLAKRGYYNGLAFQRVIPDASGVQARDVRRILLCAGKIAYELEKRRQDLGRHDVAIVRVEQLYPLPKADIEAAIGAYAVGTPAVWVQEEPENMGAWRFYRIHFGEKLLDRFPFSGVCRQSAASPATGSKKSHDMEQNELLSAAFQS